MLNLIDLLTTLIRTLSLVPFPALALLLLCPTTIIIALRPSVGPTIVNIIQAFRFPQQQERKSTRRSKGHK